MPASTVIDRLRELSGRYDLTKTDLLWYLNCAQRSLDSQVWKRKPRARSTAQLASANTLVHFTDVRSIKKVWAHGDNGSLECKLLTDVNEFRELSGYVDFATTVREAALVESPYPMVGDTIYCLDITNELGGATVLSDETIVARVNLTNAAQVIAISPTSPTELSILIEDGLLNPLNPSLDISAGTITIVGTDIDDAALTEVVDCSTGAGSYKTDGVFKTVSSLTTADFNYLITGDEKLTVKTGRRSFLEDIDLGQTFALTSLVFYPAFNEDVIIEIFGDLWSRSLVNDTDKTFWTEYPSPLIVWEAMRFMEVPLRNRSGVYDYAEPIAIELDKINTQDTQAYEATQAPTMDG